MTAAAFRSSELSRNSREVFDAADVEPVRVTRRDGGDLILMSARVADQRAELLRLAADLIAVTTDDHGSLTDRMGKVFPWMLALDSEDRNQCAADLIAAARASFATNQPHLAATTLLSWRETATAVAAGLGGMAVDWLDRPTRVERP